jgi:hypothetical protein
LPEFNFVLDADKSAPALDRTGSQNQSNFLVPAPPSVSREPTPAGDYVPTRVRALRGTDRHNL